MMPLLITAVGPLPVAWRWHWRGVCGSPWRSGIGGTGTGTGTATGTGMEEWRRGRGGTGTGGGSGAEGGGTGGWRGGNGRINALGAASFGIPVGHVLLPQDLRCSAWSWVVLLLCLHPFLNQ